MLKFLLVLLIWKSIPAYAEPGFPIVIRGERALIGEPISFLEAHAYRKQSWHRVRIQIDEVNVRGDYVLEGGLPFTANSDNGYYDSNDEVVFWSADLGDAFDKKDIPKKLRRSAARLWQIKAKHKEGDIGQLLVISRRHPVKQISSEQLAKFDRSDEMVETKVYRYKFHKERAALLGQVEIREGKGWRPAIRDSTFVMALRLPWYLPDFDLGESNFISTIESWRVGPIRSIVAVGVKLRRFLALFDFHMFSELIFYENALQIPTVIEFTFDPSKYFKPGTGLAYALQFEPGTPWEIESNLGSLPEVEAKKAFQDKPVVRADERYVVGASSGPFVVDVNVRVDEKARRLAPPPMVFGPDELASADQRDRWEWLGDLKGDLGVFVEISSVQEGVYDFGLDLILHPRADEKRITELDSFSTQWSRLPTQ